MPLRASIFTVLLVFLAFSPALAGDTIKVLITDGEFASAPSPDEHLSRLDTVSGNFVLGLTTYRGDLEVWRGENGLYVINELPLEDYVEGVVKAESGSDWALEALKAQAVVVRTYVLHQKVLNRDRKYDITSSVLHQLYKGNNSDSLVAHAVRQTRGEILTYENQPIVAYYHSTSGGKTELPEEVFGQSLPYLGSVKTDCTLSPLCLWARRIPLEEIERATNAKKISEIKILSHTSTGRVKDIEIVSNPRTMIIEAKDLRRLLGWKRLPSTDFTLKIDGDSADIEGKGYGHGVGLCQWSALEMALEGRNYREILSHFYPGTEITAYDDSGL